jgi:hypothetical protein
MGLRVRLTGRVLAYKALCSIPNKREREMERDEERRVGERTAGRREDRQDNGS